MGKNSFASRRTLLFNLNSLVNSYIVSSAK